jgi:hypothetical protein
MTLSYAAKLGELEDRFHETCIPGCNLRAPFCLTLQSARIVATIIVKR